LPSISERRDALVSFLTAVRQFRRFLMYSDLTFEIVPATPESKGTVLVEGRNAFDAAVDEAYTRLMIVAGSEEIIEEAGQLTTRLNDFIRIRAERGKGNVPNLVIREFREAERRFARGARVELER